MLQEEEVKDGCQHKEKKYRRRIRNKNRAIKMELYKSMLLFKCEQDHLNTVL